MYSFCSGTDGQEHDDAESHSGLSGGESSTGEVNRLL